MKKRMIKIAAALLLTGMLMSEQLHYVLAEDGSSDVVVGYTPDSDMVERYWMKVEVIGHGKVYDGKQEIKDNPSIYQLLVDEKKAFRLEAAKGSHLSKVMYDGDDITKDLRKGNQLTVKGKEHDTILRIVFALDIHKTVDTSDNTHSDLFIFMTVISGCALMICIYKKRKGGRLIR